MRSFYSSASFRDQFLNKEKHPILSFNENSILATYGSVGCIILSCMIITKCIFGYTFNPTIIQILIVHTNVTLAWDVMASLRLNKTVGHYILIVQRAFIKIIPLVSILTNFLFSFIFPFVYLVNDLPNYQCFAAFSSVNDVIYTLEKAIFNSIDFTEFKITDKLGLLVTHGSFLVIACIIILNIFIAIVSDVFSVISQHKHIFLSVSSIIFVKQNYLFFYGWTPWKRKNNNFIFHGDKIIIETVNTIRKVNI